MASTNQEECTTVETFPSENNSSTHSLLSRGGSGYESLYGSFFGSHFSLTDGSGLYISSLALTVILSTIAFIAIALVSVVITLSVMLSACEQRHNASLNSHSYCLSYQLNMELKNLQGLAVPSECASQISSYIQGEQYLDDFEAVVGSAKCYLKGLGTDHAENHTLVLDIDETALSNFLSSNKSLESYADFLSTSTNTFDLIPLAPMLNLYSELSAANWNIIFLSERPGSTLNATARNLLAAGYRNWASLILRSDDEVSMTVEDYKSRKKVQLEQEGYHIKAVMGDQWSDLTGSTTGVRAFKLPNPVYQIL